MAVKYFLLLLWQQHAFLLSPEKFNIYFSTCERKLFWKIESHFTYSIKRCAKEANEAPDMKQIRRMEWNVLNGRMCTCEWVSVYFVILLYIFRFQSKFLVHMLFMWSDLWNAINCLVIPVVLETLSISIAGGIFLIVRRDTCNKHTKTHSYTIHDNTSPICIIAEWQTHLPLSHLHAP